MGKKLLCPLLLCLSLCTGALAAGDTDPDWDTVNGYTF